MIKAFLFDNGGVMSFGGGGNEICERLGANLGISADDAFQLLHFPWDAYVTGKITEDELWDEVEKNYGKPIDSSKRDIWNKWEEMQPIPGMLNLVQRLRQDGYVVGMLSNVIPNTRDEIKAHSGYEGFDFLVLSCDVGFAKPDPEIYRIAMNKLSRIEVSEVVFLDDQERFLVPAREFGMKTILVKNPLEAISDIESLIGQ